MYIDTNFFIENLKSWFNINNIMTLIQDFDTLCFYMITVLMSLMIFTFVLILIYAPYNNYQIGMKNIISLPLFDNLNKIIV